MVADEPLAAQCGVEILRRGGNAVDAAVAVAFALAVTYPQAGNLAGGGFMLVRTAKGEAVFLDYREVAPRAATADMFAGGGAAEGWRSAGVPGTVAGLAYALERYGTRPWRELLEPAIRLARGGFPVGEGLAKDLEEARSRLAGSPESRRIFLPRGRPPEPGETIQQKALARTLETLARRGPRDFYEGSIARRLAREMARHGGLVSLDDLRSYRVRERKPLEGSFRGYEIRTAPPPSAGGMGLLEILNALDRLLPERPDPGNPELVHVVAEAMRRAFADRARYLGDPDFACVPVEALLSPSYAQALARSIVPRSASRSGRLELPDPALVAGISPPCGPAPPAPSREGSETTHFAVADAEGNVVANTYTLNDSFGSGIAVPGLGFLLNDEMDDFTTRPGASNLYGLVQSEANRIEPGKRPVSSMMPTLVLREGEPVLVLGSPGGSRIVSAVTLVLFYRLACGLSLEEAIAAPRFHHQWLPDVLFVEGEGFSAGQLEALRGFGHEVRSISEMGRSGWKFSGQVNAIERDPKTGRLLGVADGRRNGAARGF